MAPRRASRSRLSARTVFAALVLLSAAAVACGPGGEGAASSPVADSTYVHVMARLALLDTALSRGPRIRFEISRDSARRIVLRRWDADADSLVAYAERWGGDPEKMTTIWARVRELADSLEAARWSPVSPSDTSARGDASGGEVQEP